MQVKNRVYNNTLYVLLSGELDEHSASGAREKLDVMFEGKGFRQIIIDLSELGFMDSTGIGVLIGDWGPLGIPLPSMPVPKILCGVGAGT